MAKTSSRTGFSRIGSVGGIALMVLGFYVLFMSWESHRRSAFHELPSAQDRLLAGRAPLKACKSVSVAIRGSSVNFFFDGRPLEEPPTGRGFNVVTIDPERQEVADMKNYDVLDAAGTVIQDFASDFSQLTAGTVVIVGVDDSGIENLGQPSLDVLGGIGSSITQGSFRGYALIGIKGGSALAEGQGTSAQALGALPCNGGLPLHPKALRGEGASKVGGALPDSSAPRDAPVSDDSVGKEASGNDLDDSVETPASDASASDELDESGGEQAEVKSPEVSEKVKEEETKEKVSEQEAAAKISQGPIEGSPETTVDCVGGQGDRSCLYKNLYYIRGRFVMFRTATQRDPSNIEVHRADKYEGLWRPDIEKFDDPNAIKKHLNSKAVIEEHGLSVQFNPLFHHNIGHALFDGLYPAFLATVKLKVQDRPWRPVVAVDPGCFDEGAVGVLKPGNLIEAYLPHPKYGRTLRAVRARVVKVPQTKMKDPECHWLKDLDHGGLDLGSEQVGGQANQKVACIKVCAMTFGCKACVLFADVCYLKGEGGHRSPNGGRQLCELKGERPKADVVIKPEPGLGHESKEIAIPETWITGQVRRRCMSEGIYEMFGGTSEIRRLFELERDGRNYPDLVVRFEELVVGVGGAGNMIADRSGAIGGSLAPHNAMIQFRDRMLRSYGLPVARGVNPLPSEKKLNVIVISNKRFQPLDRRALDDIVDQLNIKGDVHAEFIDWGRIGGSENKFKEHLKRTQKADIYVSSIGTALQYVPFLRDGKVYIAIGSVWMRSGQYFPTFMEQQLAGGGTPYLRTLYADPGGVLRGNKNHAVLGEDGFFAGVNGTLVSELMHQAEALVRKGFEIPVAPEENLSVEARILVELCRKDPVSCKTMMDNRNGAIYECALLLWNEAVVYEVGPWRKGKMCGSAHHKLLRKLRKQHGLPGYGAPEDDDESSTLWR